MKKLVSAACLLSILVFGLAAPAVLAANEEVQTPRDTMFASARIEPKIPIKAFSFSLKQVRLLPGPFKEAMERDLEYLLSLDPDRLLHTFRLAAGLPSSAQPYGGWEEPDGELRGHSTGHYLSACAFLYASTGNEKIKANAEYTVAGLAECQRELGDSGYLSAYPEEFFDRVFSVRRVWAPFYTLHKIMAGLIDMYECCDSALALELVENIARWVKSRTDLSSGRHMEIVLNHTEQGGMNEVLSNLYSITGKPDHLATARRFDERHYTEPLLRFRDEMTGQHVNSFIPNIIGTAREYELTADRSLFNIATYFWRQVTQARTYVTGGMSNHERWRTDPYDLEGELGTNTQESCCTYNMLKLTRHLFNWKAEVSYADYYERALFNGILSTQNPEDGMMMYHVAMMPGMYKTFMAPEDSFWCCTGTGMENHAKYGDSIYFHNDESLYANLFIASELSWPEKGLRVRQETRFPEEPGTTLTISTDDRLDLALRIRIPGWIAEGGRVKINGEELGAFASPGSFLTIQRTWTSGDRVDVSLPMDLRLEWLPGDPKSAAVLYGPIVLAAPLGAEGLTEDKISNAYAPSGDPIPVPVFKVPQTDPNAWIKPVESEPLTFQTQGVGDPQDVTLIPFYKLFGERYSIYWTLLLPGQEETEQPRP
jgi:DUF1680 family protein